MSVRRRTSLSFPSLVVPTLALLSLGGCSTGNSGGSEPAGSGTIDVTVGDPSPSGSDSATVGPGSGSPTVAAPGSGVGPTSTGGTAAGPTASASSPGGTASSPGGTASSPGATATGPGPAPAGAGGATGGAGGATGSAGGATGGAGGNATGPSAPVGDVECELPDLPDVGDLPDLGIKLPDPFTFFDGTPVTTKAEWECRRKEILAMAAKYLYGPVPGDCDEVSGSVSGGDISITCKVGDKSENFSASISGSGESINLDLSAGILPRGKSLDLGSGYEGKITSLYGLSELNPNIANAWMVNRVMDVLEQNPDSGHDPTKMAVSGCSGCGKGAFFVGVFSRIPLTIIVESGGGGGSSWRMTEWFTHGEGQSRWNCSDRPQGIDVLEETGICGPWVTSVAKPFRDAPAKVNNLPFDQHMLLATIAPRYLVHFSNDQSQWCWLAGTSESLASWAAHSVYNALGVPENHSFEIYAGGHCGVGDTGIAEDMFDRAINGNMDADTGKINIQDSRVMIPVSEWKDLFIDWDMDTVLQ